MATLLEQLAEARTALEQHQTQTTQFQERITALEAECASAKEAGQLSAEQKSQFESQITEMTGHLETANQQLAAAQEEIATLRGNAQTVDELAAEKAVEQTAAVGVQPVSADTKGAITAAEPSTKDEAWAQYNDLKAAGKSRDASALYQKHKALMNS